MALPEIKAAFDLNKGVPKSVVGLLIVGFVIAFIMMAVFYDPSHKLAETSPELYAQMLKQDNIINRHFGSEIYEDTQYNVAYIKQDGVVKFLMPIILDKNGMIFYNAPNNGPPLYYVWEATPGQPQIFFYNEQNPFPGYFTFEDKK